MPAASKRSRQTDEDENQPQPSTSTSTPSPRTTRRAAQQASPTTPTAAARPILTRSATTQHTPNPSGHLTRSTSLIMTPSTRRGSSSSSALSIGHFGGALSAGPSSSPSVMREGGNRGGAGVLSRTQSTPIMMGAPASLKAASVSSSGGSSGRSKGDPEDGLGSGGGPKRHGKGKENIPPKKDEDQENSRKRLRVTRNPSGSGRGRSNSVVSVRSESSSIGRHTSLAPSSSSFSRRTSTTLPSPSPSPSNAPSQASAASSATSVDPLDLLNGDEEEENDVEATPTKARPIPRRQLTLPTPPPSSPLTTDLQETTKRIELIRMRSSASSIAGTETDVDIDMEETIPVKAKNPYKHLKSFLRLSAHDIKGTTDQVIVGRDDEKAILRSYLSLRGSSDVGLYVSGPPGTGKTASVTAIGREMALEGWKVAEIGCMGLKVGDLWTRLGEALKCGKTEESVIAHLKESQDNTLLILDEIDSLLPPSPALPPPATSHLLSKIFAFPLLSDCTSTVKLISISNTLDLTVRARLVLPEGTQPQVLPFKAYVATDMVSILNSRISASMINQVETETVKVDTKAVELLTRKVEAQNGDLRMCLGCLSSAVNLAEAEWVKKAFLSEDSDVITPLTKVSLPHILKAFNSHTQQLRAAAGTSSSGGNQISPNGKKIRSVPLQGKMVLVSILVYLGRCRVGLPGSPSGTSSSSGAGSGSGSSTPNVTPTKGNGLDTNTLYATYAHLLNHHTSPFPPAAESDYRDLLSNIETLGLVSIGGNGFSVMSRSGSGNHGRSTKSIKVELCIREDELREGLGLNIDGNSKGLADEEVGKVWNREAEKIERARQKASMKIAGGGVGGEE